MAKKPLVSAADAILADLKKEGAVERANLIAKKSTIKGKNLVNDSSRVGSGISNLTERVNDNEQKLNILPKRLNGIAQALNGVASILSSQTLFQKKQIERQKKLEDLQRKRELEKERESEKNVGEKIKSFVSKPVKGFFDQLLNFVTGIALGSAFLGLYNWLQDESNLKKLQAVADFLKDYGISIFNSFLKIARLRIGTRLFNALSRITAKAVEFSKLGLAGTAIRIGDLTSSTVRQFRNFSIFLSDLFQSIRFKAFGGLKKAKLKRIPLEEATPELIKDVKRLSSRRINFRRRFSNFIRGEGFTLGSVDEEIIAKNLGRGLSPEEALKALDESRFTKVGKGGAILGGRVSDTAMLPPGVADNKVIKFIKNLFKTFEKRTDESILRGAGLLQDTPPKAPDVTPTKPPPSDPDKILSEALKAQEKPLVKGRNISGFELDAPDFPSDLQLDDIETELALKGADDSNNVTKIKSFLNNRIGKPISNLVEKLIPNKVLKFLNSKIFEKILRGIGDAFGTLGVVIDGAQGFFALQKKNIEAAMFYFTAGVLGIISFFVTGFIPLLLLTIGGIALSLLGDRSLKDKIFDKDFLPFIKDLIPLGNKNKKDMGDQSSIQPTGNNNIALNTLEPVDSGVRESLLPIGLEDDGGISGTSEANQTNIPSFSSENPNDIEVAYTSSIYQVVTS